MTAKTQQQEKPSFINHLDATEPRWFAVYTGFRKEKVAHALLQKKHIQSYLPMQNFRRQWGRKVKQVDIPLISCYLFVKITNVQYTPVLETEYVLNFVRFSKDLIAIPEQEIIWLKRIMEEEDIEVEVMHGGTADFEEGDRVEVLTGRLAGLKGKLLHKQGKQSFMVELAGMGHSLSLTVDSSLLRKI
jgi:transcription antitermination factor NusG